MFRWFRKPAPVTPVARKAPFHDEVLGDLVWDPEFEAWDVVVTTASDPFRIRVSGADRPASSLLPLARELFRSPDGLASAVMPLLAAEAIRYPEVAEEVSGLRIDVVALPWPDRPDDAVVYFDGPETDERQWRCDYFSRLPQNLGFDD